MRVITGKARGHKLKAPKGFKTRPTLDRVKESIFNIIGEIPGNSVVLDLFSGSGSIGIEFLSRGAGHCYFIDNNMDCISVINENLKKTKLTDYAHVYKNDVHKAVEILGKKNINFDFIFMDPPYEKNLVLPTLEYICRNKVIKKDGIILIEHEAKNKLPENFLDLIKYDERKYGETMVTFYRYEEV